MTVHLIDLYMMVTLKHMLTAFILFSKLQRNPMKHFPYIYFYRKMNNWLPIISFNAGKYQACIIFYGFDNIRSLNACIYFMNCEFFYW